MSKGMSRFILVVYSNALATLILLPYAILVESVAGCVIALHSRITPKMEKLDLKNSRSLVKIMGTLVLISGAMIIVFYNGSPIGTVPDSSTENTYPTNQSPTTNYWIIRGLFIAIASVSKAVSISDFLFSLRLNAAVIKEYPSQKVILKPDVELISVFYTAIIGNALTLSVQMWCTQKKGPLFVAMFAPLGIAIAAIMGAIFLGDTL
ncbi:hypothetical protein FNV43_RR19827 [Rhamnella rubrinervis]|uniref:WAT1-related protein n=1 Tax=Rhamnella rubrinervis TaxID=2594499 RepID=A0A8K0DZZ7_9ROSA|nr:hypothetical protein FNV43_RR19827 [Rhamnella rubrinervis]